MVPKPINEKDIKLEEERIALQKHKIENWKLIAETCGIFIDKFKVLIATVVIVMTMLGQLGLVAFNVSENQKQDDKVTKAVSTNANKMFTTNTARLHKHRKIFNATNIVLLFVAASVVPLYFRRKKKDGE